LWPRMYKKAYTFIELLFVVLIIGILIGVSVPQLKRAAQGFALDDAVKNLYYFSRYLRETAVSEGKVYCLNIDTTNGLFWGTFLDTETEPDKENRFISLPGRFEKKLKIPSGSQVVTEPPDKTRVFFYPDGRIENIKIIISNDYVQTRSLTIKGATGEIKIE